MNKAQKFFGFLMWVIVLQLKAQPYSVGHTTLSLTDASRSNRSIPVEVYYPAATAGDNVPVSGNKKFPVIAFGHGFVMTWDAYKNIWLALVPEGLIVAFPKTEGSASPSHSEFGKDLAFVVSAMDLQGKNASSPFYNKVDTMNCVMGHSMGGGAAFIATSVSPKIKFIATLAAAETTPSAVKAAASLKIPSLVVAGGNDCTIP
jgi:predicted dienelactone hydrolase